MNSIIYFLIILVINLVCVYFIIGFIFAINSGKKIIVPGISNPELGPDTLDTNDKLGKYIAIIYLIIFIIILIIFDLGLLPKPKYSQEEINSRNQVQNTQLSPR